MTHTFCEDCKHCDKTSKHQRYWLCRRHKRVDGFGFITKDMWDNAEPFLYCRNVNGGLCPLYEEIKEVKE